MEYTIAYSITLVRHAAIALRRVQLKLHEISKVLLLLQWQINTISLVPINRRHIHENPGSLCGFTTVVMRKQSASEYWLWSLQPLYQKRATGTGQHLMSVLNMLRNGFLLFVAISSFIVLVLGKKKSLNVSCGLTGAHNVFHLSSFVFSKFFFFLLFTFYCVARNF